MSCTGWIIHSIVQPISTRLEMRMCLVNFHSLHLQNQGRMSLTLLDLLVINFCFPYFWQLDFIYLANPNTMQTKSWVIVSDFIIQSTTISGDLGQTADSNRTLQHYMESKGQTVLFVGDCAYADKYPFYDNNRWDTWGRFVERSTAYQPWIWSAGNHDIEWGPEFVSQYFAPFPFLNVSEFCTSVHYFFFPFFPKIYEFFTCMIFYCCLYSSTFVSFILQSLFFSFVFFLPYCLRSTLFSLTL